MPSIDATVLDTTDPVRYRASRRVTIIGVGVNFGLACGQIVLGITGGSQALVADGVHTMSDIVTDLMVLFAVWQGAKAADAEHPYGHSRFETAATVGVAIMLLLVALGISINAGRRLMSPETLGTPLPFTLLMVVVTILSKEGLFRYTTAVARRFHSNLLQANAWHHRSDAVSSFIVFVGIAGSLMGMTYLDAVAAIGVAMMIAKIGWELGNDALKELVDTGLDAEQVAKIRNTILAADGVTDLHLLRTRRMGGQALVDVHIQVDSRISISEGHHISEAVRRELIDKFVVVTDVTVHIDPEDDEAELLNLGLPMRTEITQRLDDALSGMDDARYIDKVTLHYLCGKVSVELFIPISKQPDDAVRLKIAREFREAVNAHDDLKNIIESVTVHFAVSAQ
ncbi:MAG: cation diffusion facilitator family transporter [Gammaproteobacteria bacterium]|nr:cation diffusion facilitator family transporter [Gammaproteobacteria bacterium]